MNEYNRKYGYKFYYWTKTMSLIYVKWNFRATSESVHFQTLCVTFYRTGSRNEQLQFLKKENVIGHLESKRQRHAQEYTLPIPGATLKNKTMHEGLENVNLPLRGFERRFYVSNIEEFSYCRKRQQSYNQRNTLKLRGNRERNFDGAFSSSFEITFFWVYGG